MHRELVAMYLCNDLANIVVEWAARQMSQFLGAEKSKHKLYFKDIWEKEILTEN